MEALAAELQNHAKLFDESCPICSHKSKALIEKWYIQRKSLAQLTNIFGISEQLLELHAKAVKIYKRRAHNTGAIVDIMLEEGLQALREGKMALTVKDLAWAIGHRDRILGRIRDKVDVNIAPTLVLHTTIPGVGGIANSDVAAIKATKVTEMLPKMPEVTYEVLALSESSVSSEPAESQK